MCHSVENKSIMAMKRFILLLVLCVVPVAVFSQQQSTTWLKGLDSTLGDKFAMEVEVCVAEEPIMGYFMVEGDGYYISLGIMEVYSDGKLRYEINNERKEVTEDRVDLSSCDLLTNPTRAFDFLGDEFSSEVVSSSATMAIVRLTPTDKELGISAIEVYLERKGAVVEPKKVVYDYDGESVVITTKLLNLDERKLPTWNKNAYRAYDIVSFL